MRQTLILIGELRVIVYVLFICININVLTSADEFESVVKPFLKKHCVSCHGPKKEKGGLRVDLISNDLSDLSNVDHLQNIADQLVVGEMPPEDEIQPTVKEVSLVLKVLIDKVKEAHDKYVSGGGRPLRRLTQQEYINTVYDLLGVTIQKSELPSDGDIGSFDTYANSLYTTDMHLETYLVAARNVVKKFIASRNEKPGEIKVGVFFKEGIKKGNFVIGTNHDSYYPQVGHLKIQLTCWQRDPNPNNRLFIGERKPGGFETFEIRGTRESPQIIEFTLNNRVKDISLEFLNDISNVSTVSAIKGFEKLNNKERKIQSKATYDKVRNLKVNRENIVELQQILKKHPVIISDIAGFKVIKPQPYAFFKNVGVMTETQDNAEKVIRHFSKLISRGQMLDDQFMTSLNQIFLQGRQQGETFWGALVEPLAISMCSLSFLFHIEDSSDSKQNCSGIELANRLSYYLWRSSPDVELLKLGRSGKLLSKMVLEGQISRMMSDTKFDRFLNDFTFQWLELERQELIAVDERLYPNFNPRLKRDLAQESIAFISKLVRENLSITNLIDSDFKMLNNKTSLHYGIENIFGDDFRAVSQSELKNKVYGGLMTHAGILMQTGTGSRTSIVERGVFIGEKFLNDEPPPPPANVDPLDSENSDTLTMSAAEMLKHHRSTPQCASCHNKIDPLGLGLEEFDAIGLYREIENRLKPEHLNIKVKKRNNNFHKLDYLKVKLETHGQLPNGTSFRGINGLKEVLYKDKGLLAKSFIEALLSFANGRKSGVADKSIVEEVMAKTKYQNFPVRSIIESVLVSPALTSDLQQ